ncbi:MAG: permease [Endomicrobiia bacterium]|nr:permease [Endomicrobiia bacterium]
MAKDPICGMNVAGTTALKATLDGKTYYFCSPHCLAKFLEDNPSAAKIETGAHIKKISESPETDDVCPSCVVAPVSDGNVLARILKNKTFLAAATLTLLTALSFFFVPLVGFRRNLSMYLEKIWWAILLGFALGGIIDRFIPRGWVTKTLSGRGYKTILRSVLLGFMMSACSHGMLALSVQLYKKGASPAAVVSFLLASPWANLAMTAMLIGFFGVKGLYIIFAALIIAITTGLIFQKLESKNLVEKNPNAATLIGIIPGSENFSIMSDAATRLKNYRFTLVNITADAKGVVSGAAALADMVGWWILLGVGISSMIAAYVPAHFIHSYFGPTFAGLLATLGVATVIEVCSEGSAPVAFEIFRQTGALGNSFVFLMAGVATDYTEIGILWTNIGKKTALWMVAITVPQVVALGILANVIFR